MKVRNYEKLSFTLFACIFTFILEITFIVIIFQNKIYKYDELSGIVMKDNITLLVLSKKQRKIIHKNTYIYIDDKKIKYKVIEDKGVIITKGEEKYYEILINYRFPQKKKSNDTVSLSIKTEKYRLIEIFKLIWDGD